MFTIHYITLVFALDFFIHQCAMKKLVLGFAVIAAMSCIAASDVWSRNSRVECAEPGFSGAAHLSLYHINDYHKQGYQFNLRNIRFIRVKKDNGKCEFTMDLGLEETTCHVVDPKPFQECQFRDGLETPVEATCHVTLTIEDGAVFITSYNCETKRAITHEELIKICPDCNLLLDLDDEEGLKSVEAAVRQFNQNTTNQRYYVLQDVGRMSSGYIMMMGMMYYAEYALVETYCPMGSRIHPEACTPLCPRRARHAFCHSTYVQSSGAVTQVCEFYKAQDTATLSNEPTCPFGTPAGVPGPFQPFSTCHSSSTDKAVHPICDWPSPRS